MAEKLTIARPYAKAVFEQALANKSLEEWEQILQVLAMVASEPSVAVLLDNPLVSDQQRLALFTSVIEKKAVKNFLEELIAEKRLAILPEILHRYQRLLAAERELKEVTIISAYPLNEERRQSMAAALTRYLHSKVSIDFKEDASLIGGAIIRSGNWVMDGSIKGKLQRLRDNLAE